MSSLLSNESRSKSLSLAAHSFHKPKNLCIICACQALAQSYYLLYDSQEELDNHRPTSRHPKFPNPDTSVVVLDSSCSLSVHYLLTNLQDNEHSEFEAYLCVARNLIEKISRIIDVNSDETQRKQSSQDFETTYDDVRHLFEANNPRKTAKELKQAKWLGRGTNKNNIQDEKYELIYAYISRVLHCSNMDSLLGSSSTRFFIKSYILIEVMKLYHLYIKEVIDLDNEASLLHEKCYDSIQDIWSEKGVTTETLVYCTSFYEDLWSEGEVNFINSYKRTLESCFKIYKDKGFHVLPNIPIHKS